MRGLVTYTTRQLKTKEELVAVKDFLNEAGQRLEEEYPEFPDWKNFNLPRYANIARFVVSFRDGEPVGFMMSHMTESVFQQDITILRQDILYAKPNTRAAYHLMQDFLDFGHIHADHILTMIGARTNVKRQSLEKLGFKKVEELYRIEV